MPVHSRGLAIKGNSVLTDIEVKGYPLKQAHGTEKRRQASEQTRDAPGPSVFYWH